MADSYKKVYLHLIFVVKNREALLAQSWRQTLFKYMAASLKARGHFPLAVNGYHDHIHLAFDYNCQELIPDLVRELKKSSNKFINENKFCNSKFEWQSGYGLFSEDHRSKKMIINYIEKQETHHSKKCFKAELIDLFKKYQIPHEEKYLFDFLEEIKIN
ncbi:MAG: transposase [Saprospiraceae bacterium]|nr:transposase [Saprospiraceae bacterium]